MSMRLLLGFLAFLLWTSTAEAGFIETESLKEKVSKGELPPVEQRLPQHPLVVDLSATGKTPGEHGGTVRMLIGGQRNISLMTVSGYTRLVRYDEKLQLQPDVLESYEVQDGRIFTFHLRPGHKWSDGAPLTPEDFRYALEDVQLDEDLTKGIISPYLLVNGKPPKFEIVDDLTVRYSWDAPNPDFLPQIAAPQPLSMVMPAHYLKQFHKKYQDEAKLKELMKANKEKKWTGLHINKARQYRPENPDLPMLDPWRNTTKPPAEQFVFERNPYFHRVDKEGRQLPYIDRFVLNVSSSSLIPAKAGAGEADLQGNFISFGDYTFLKEAELSHPIRVKLWESGRGSRIALFPNLNYEDAEWRKILQDVRFRRALSLAIDRREINLAVFFGLGKPSADTVLPASPLYREEYAKAYTNFDPTAANILLDEMGLTQRDSDGIRLLPDGRRAEIIIETAGEDLVETDVLELITDHWSKIGIKLLPRTSQTDVLRSRIIGGKVMMAMASGLDNGIPTADMNPKALAPTSHEQMQWSQWGIFVESGGEKGSQVDLKEAKELDELYRQWRQTSDSEMRSLIWHQMLKLYTEQVFTIGIVNSTLQPIVASTKLHNVPDKVIYSFDPTGYFGIYGMDTFWLDKGGS
ncbi:ABC transporter substrate-binding protein [Taklimakanibacter deserti]|uniref:ABC transporter substrate-binding protein n=1 Tax=Taklimakanibacter deserti TaxID=2267839 RepID=UPI000E6576DC